MLQKKHAWLILLLGVIALQYGTSYINIKIDCTEEKRYTLSPASQQLLERIQEPITVKILMENDLPVEFKKLKNSVTELLDRMNIYAHHLIRYELMDPLSISNDSLKNKFLDTLYALGIRPTNVNKRKGKNGTQEKKVVFPAAIIQSKNKIFGISFLSETLINNIESLNNAEALLEYKLTSAIEKITQTQKPFIAYAVGHQEPLDYRVRDLFNTLYPHYNFDTLNLKTCAFVNHKKYDLLLIVKPLATFSDEEKLKIDQFVLHGGKAFFILDNVFAEMQNLQEQKQMVAQNLNLQLDDLLFHYGARLDYNLLQDLQCDRLPIQVGWNGDKPQFELLPWYYFPLLIPNDEHPITKNLDLIESNFVSSISMNQNNKINKTALLHSSQQTKKQGTPSLISFETLKENATTSAFQFSFLPTAVLLESVYHSLYANRLTDDMKMKYEQASQNKIRTESLNKDKIIVVADADVVLNPITQKEGPLMMGMNPYTKFQFANKVFFENCLEYLLSTSNIIENRNKNFTLRLLNKKKIEEEASFWAWCNLLMPIFLTLFFYFIYAAWRWKKYTSQ